MSTKAARKRIKVTKTGKLLHRKPGISHCLAKKSGGQIRVKRNTVTVTRVDEKRIKQYL